MQNTHSHPHEAPRLWFLDLLRILATYGIVLLHTSPLPVEHSAVDGLPWRIVITISILFRWCVPAFIMISGALFLSPEKSFSTGRLYKKTILRIVTCFLFWSSFYAAAHCIIMGKGKWTFLNQLLRGHYHMWFIFTILALYMLTPLLRKMTESRKLTEYFLVLGLLFTFLFPRLLAFIQLFAPPHADVIASMQSAVAQVNPLSGACALYYYVLGHYLCAYPPRKALHRPLIAAGALGCIATIVLTIWHSALLGTPSGQFYDMSSISVLAMTVGVFVLFQYGFVRFMPTASQKRALLMLSTCSFGVYLAHPFFIERIQPTLPPSPIVLIVGMPLTALGIYALSMAVSMLLHRIPVISKYIV